MSVTALSSRQSTSLSQNNNDHSDHSSHSSLSYSNNNSRSSYSSSSYSNSYSPSNTANNALVLSTTDDRSLHHDNSNTSITVYNTSPAIAWSMASAANASASAANSSADAAREFRNASIANATGNVVSSVVQTGTAVVNLSIATVNGVSNTAVGLLNLGAVAIHANATNKAMQRCENVANAALNALATVTQSNRELAFTASQAVNSMNAQLLRMDQQMQRMEKNAIRQQITHLKAQHNLLMALQAKSSESEAVILNPQLSSVNDAIGSLETQLNEMNAADEEAIVRQTANSRSRRIDLAIDSLNQILKSEEEQIKQLVSSAQRYTVAAGISGTTAVGSCGAASISTDNGIRIPAIFSVAFSALGAFYSYSVAQSKADNLKDMGVKKQWVKVYIGALDKLQSDKDITVRAAVVAELLVTDKFIPEALNLNPIKGILHRIPDQLVQGNLDETEPSIPQDLKYLISHAGSSAENFRNLKLG